MTNSPGVPLDSPGTVAVDVWRLPLDLPSAAIAELMTTLSTDERARAARYHFERDRRRFVAARGLVRTMLGGYLSVAAGTIVLQYDRYGKPSLARSPLDLRFNVTHSGNVALLAVAHGFDVGIDVEVWRALPDRDSLSARFFAASEAAAIAELPEHVRDAAFFTCWTRKEAYVKAVGIGLSAPLDSFEVSVLPGQPAALLRIHGGADAARAWSLYDLSRAPAYSAAVAIRAAPARICVRDVVPDRL